MACHNLETIRRPYEEEINCIPKELVNDIKYILLIVSWNGTWIGSNFCYDEQFLEACITYKNEKEDYYFRYGTWTNWRKGKLVCDGISCETYSDGLASTELSDFLDYLSYAYPDEDIHDYPTSIEYIIFDAELANQVLGEKEAIEVEYDIYGNIDITKPPFSEFLRAVEILLNERYPKTKVLEEHRIQVQDQVLREIVGSDVKVELIKIDTYFNTKTILRVRSGDIVREYKSSCGMVDIYRYRSYTKDRKIYDFMIHIDLPIKDKDEVLKAFAFDLIFEDIDNVNVQEDIEGVYMVEYKGTPIFRYGLDQNLEYVNNHVTV